MAVHVRDFPFGMRMLLILTLFVCGVNILLFVPWLFGAAAMGSIPAPAWTLVGTLVGAIIGASVSTHLARQTRLNDALDIAISLHTEIADRATRCLNDYLAPWREYDIAAGDTAGIMPVARVSKFRPVDPVVYPAVGAKLGLLKPEALFPVVQFYFRLDAVRREIDMILTDDSFPQRFSEARHRLRLVTRRFRETLAPARLALINLEVSDAYRIEDEAAHSYPNVRHEEKSLRELLRTHQLP